MGLTLGVLVPCRNEAAVIARKLRNLALCARPEASHAHRIVVVDDGSTDGTAECARAAGAQIAGVRFDVISNDLRPGKSGAIEAGLRALAHDVDLVVLTDADVVLDPRALVALAAAFEREPALAMATGAQRFVRSLANDGRLRDEGAGELVDDGTPYDRFTALVRAIESRWGLVFSVHGQLMAWRASLALSPTPGIAADDLDLMLQVRTRGLRVERVGAARFFEVRAPRGDAREQQALRRARAWLQFLEHPRIAELTSTGPWLRRLHAALYTSARVRACGVAAAYVGALGALLWLLPGSIVVVYLIGAVVAATVAVYVAIHRRLATLAFARELERRGSMNDRWETARR